MYILRAIMLVLLIDKKNIMVYDNTVLKINKKDIHSPPVVCRQQMGIRRKGTSNTLPTYECHSIGYYSLFWVYCQVRIPFRVSSDEGIMT